MERKQSIITDNKEEFLKGIDSVYKAVKQTFGPNGKHVYLKTIFGDYVITTDGVTVARNIFFEDESIKNMGAELIRTPSLSINQEHGDGTSSVIVLTKHLIDQNLELNEIDKDKVKKILKELSIPYNIDKEIIEKVALIASNGDKDIAKKIKKIYDDYNGHVTILIEEGYLEDKIESQKGWHNDMGIFSNYSINNLKKFAVEYNKEVNILIYDGELNNGSFILNAVNQSASEGKPLVIFTQNISDEILYNLEKLYKDKVLESAVVKLQGFGINATEYAKDLAVLTGAEIYNKSGIPHKIKLGSASKFYSDLKRTVVVAPERYKNAVQKHLNTLLERQKDVENEWEKRKLRERIDNIRGGIAIIRVGGNTPKDRKERYYRFEDAIKAVKAAEKGVVFGGGAVYALVAKKLRNKKFKKAVQSLIYDLYGKGNKVTILSRTDEDIIKVLSESKKVLEPYKMVEDIILTSIKIAELANDTSIIVHNNPIIDLSSQNEKL